LLAGDNIKPNGIQRRRRVVLIQKRIQIQKIIRKRD